VCAAPRQAGGNKAAASRPSGFAEDKSFGSAQDKPHTIEASLT